MIVIRRLWGDGGMSDGSVTQMMNGISIGGGSEVEKPTTTIMNHLEYRKKEREVAISNLCCYQPS